MAKYVFCALFLMLGLVSATTFVTDFQTQISKPICGLNQCSTPSGCWNSCTDPRFSQCGDFFPALYNPSFCAYTRDGQYISYTYECQACKNTNVIAVRSGACSCDFIKCAANQACQDGQCVNVQNDVDWACAAMRCMSGYRCVRGACVPISTDPCATVKCSAGFTCRNGFCVRNIVPIDPCSVIRCFPGTQCVDGKCITVNPCATIRCAQGYYCDNGQCIDNCAFIKCISGHYCQAGQCIPYEQPICDAKQIQCTYPRPNEHTCPTKYYLVAPTPNFCGITATGQQIGYPEACDACKDTSVQYYWTKRCEEIQPCLQQQVQLCTCDAECPAELRCDGQKCVDKCSMVKCWAGSHCENGGCVPDLIVDPPFDNCAAVLCLVGTTCVDGKCIAANPQPPKVQEDLCADIYCIATTTCIDGKCVPLPENLATGV